MLRAFIMFPPRESGAARLAVLQEIALALTGELDRRRLYEGIVQGAKKLLGVPAAAVLSWDSGREELVTEAVHGDLPRLSESPAKLGACEGRAFLLKRTVVCDDYAAEPRAPAHARGIASAVATPLLRAGEALGVLFAGHTDRARRLDPEDVRLLEVLAGHVSLALANAELVAAATRRLARTEELATLMRGVAEARDRDTIAQRALDCATTVLGADRAGVFLFENDRFRYSATRRLSRAYIDHVSKSYMRSVGGLLPLTRSPVFVADVTSDPRTRVNHEVAAREGIRSMMLAPLVAREEVIGALALYHDTIYLHDAGEIAQVRALADQVTLALAGAALHQQTMRQLAELRALDAIQRAVSDPAGDPGDEPLRCSSAAQAIVSGGGATRAWVLEVRGDALELVASAGATALAGDASLAAALAALQAGRVVTQASGGDAFVAAPIVHQDRTFGVLVLAPPRPPHVEPARGTLILEGEDRILSQARDAFASTAAGQLAVAIANARLYARARATSMQLQAVLAALPDGIIVYDQNDRVVFYNRNVLEAYGLQGVDITGWAPADFLREVASCLADPGIAHEIIRRMHGEERDRVDRIELEVVRPRRRILSRMSAPVLGSDGARIGQVVTYHDLTELRDAERPGEGSRQR
jgi:PAS domain S-box-containing protein